MVYADAGYQGVHKRREVSEDVPDPVADRAPRTSTLRTLPGPDRVIASAQAGIRAKVEHPFLIVKRDFGFVKIRYRGLAKNLNHLDVLFASANWLLRGRALALTG